jgi:hypothetical protein
MMSDNDTPNTPTKEERRSGNPIWEALEQCHEGLITVDEAMAKMATASVQELWDFQQWCIAEALARRVQRED